MFKEFEEHIRDEFPEIFQEKCILGCSGGVDSVVLAHLCSRLKIDFALAHCNFQLRDDESDRDEEFVQDLGTRINKEVFVKTFNTGTYANKNKLSIQVAARELRYGWFKELAGQTGSAFVLIAHHADDMLETFIINLSRGTGIKGLSGIPSSSGIIRRPLLLFSKAQILHYAEQNELEWREDSSNKEYYYLRNKIRHQIIPLLKELHPTFLNNFLRTQEHLKGISALLNENTTRLKSALFRQEGENWHIAIDDLSALEPLDPLLYTLFEEYGFTEWDNVRALLSASCGKQIFSKTHRLVRDRRELILAPVSTHVDQPFEFSLDTTETGGPIPMEITSVDGIGETSKSILYVDKETLNNRLEVRKWKKGDYFYPLGMKGKKLISKYFKDERLNALEKEDQWLLFSGEELVWVIGRRADERFKVRPESQSILRFSLIE